MMFLVLTELYFVKTTLVERNIPVWNMYFPNALFVILHNMTLRSFIAPSNLLHDAKLVILQTSHRDRKYLSLDFIKY
jgi:hypothetical protein